MNEEMLDFINWIGHRGWEYWPKRGGWEVPGVGYLHTQKLYEYWQRLGCPKK